METVGDLVNFLEHHAPKVWQESYDNSGLLTGTTTQAISGVLITLDCIEAVVDEAINLGCNLIIAHHPIWFSGLKRLNGQNYIERTIIKAIKNDIALYAIHTNLDNAWHGVNLKLAEVLGLKPLHTLQPLKQTLKKLEVTVPASHANAVRQALFDAGCGEIGLYNSCSFNINGNGTFKASAGAQPFVGASDKLHTEAEIKIEIVIQSHKQNLAELAIRNSHPYQTPAYQIFDINNTQQIGSGLVAELPQEITETAFLHLLKNKLNVPCIRHTALINQPISKVALCGGAGSFLLPQALANKAHAFVTADYKYHQFFDADHKILIADVGHYESEQFTKQLLYDLIKGNFNTFALHLSKVNTNPVNYFM
jgi:dinuclear metal center YbgI/SA1388 family protein